MASNKNEGVAAGTVEMFKPLVPNFAREHGFSARLRTDTSAFAKFTVSRIGGPHIGALEVQQLPGERVLIAFDYNTGEAEQDKEFDEFERLLVGRLAQLGFIQLQAAETPRRTIGFSAPTK